MRKLLRAQDGFSMVELLIGVIVLVAVTGAVAGVIKVSQTLNSTTQQGMDLEENVSSALNFICRELVNAGSGVPYLIPINGSPRILVAPTALMGPMGRAVANPYVYFITPAYQQGTPVTTDGEGNPLATPIKTDMLTFLGGTGNAGFVNQDAPGPSADWGETVYVENGALFSAGQVVLISNGFQVSLGQVTKVKQDGGLEFKNGEDSLLLNPGSTEEVPNPNMSAAQQITGGMPPQIYPLSAITYFIDGSNPSHPSLQRLANSAEGAGGSARMADDIENLAIVYMVDNDANATTPAIEIANPATNQLSLVRGVKVTITGRSRMITGDAAYPDKHSRLTSSRTVFFRNNIAR